MSLQSPQRAKQHIRQFFLLALGLSWLFWIPLAAIDQPAMEFPAVILMAAGGLGPAVAEILLIFRSGDPALKRDYRKRILDVGRVSPKWYAVIFLFFPVLHTVTILMSGLTGQGWPAFENATRLFSRPLSIVPYAIFMLFFGPVPEELGWSGYALDGLQSRFNAVISSLIVGGLWGLWHVPLFFMEGTFQAEMGLGTPVFWDYIITMLAISVLDTWIYNNTDRSTLSAILFHFMINFSGELFEPTVAARRYGTILILIVTAAVTLIWGSETLTGKPSPQPHREQAPIRT